MSSQSTPPRTTLWIWPTGLFPRRLIYYFRSKRITLHTLSAHNIHLVPVALNTSPPALDSVPGHEPRPQNASLPILRIEHANGNERPVWIRESLSILEYFEELLPSPSFPNLLGSGPEQRARTRDVLSLLNDVMHWSLIQLINSDPKTTFWSGLSEEGMSTSAAKHAKGKRQFYLDRLEDWLRDDGGATVQKTIAGVMLLADVQYHEMMYGADWIAGHGVLRAWVEEMKKEDWFIEGEVLKGVEEGKGWETVLGE